MRYLILITILLVSCKSMTIHPVLTESRGGSTLVEMVIPDTGKRVDLPANTETSQVIAIINDDRGGKITIKKNPKRTIVQRVLGKNKYNYTMDAPAQLEAKEVQEKTGRPIVEAPSPPWWQWPLIGGVILLFMAIAYFMRPIIAIGGTVIETVVSWFKRK